MLEHFDKLRHNSTYTDVIITFDKAPCQCHLHSAIVAASSKYFAEAIADGKTINDITNGLFVDVTLHPLVVNQQISQGLFSYFYTGKVPVSAKSAPALLVASHLLRLDGVTEGCAEFLQSILSTQNVIQILHMANTCECEKLKVTLLYDDEIGYCDVAHGDATSCLRRYPLAENSSGNNIVRRDMTYPQRHELSWRSDLPRSVEFLVLRATLSYHQSWLGRRNNKKKLKQTHSPGCCLEISRAKFPHRHQNTRLHESDERMVV